MVLDKHNKFHGESTYGYFLIWGHGMLYKTEIKQIIENQNFLDIIKIKDYRSPNIRKLVKQIYSHDYAPFWHLKAKTKYLLNTPNEVRFIFFKNNKPQIKHFGKGEFRHTECVRIKKLKDEIREKYNPRKKGVKTEHHVIHASDNEDQAHYAVQILGHREGAQLFKKNSSQPIQIPYYIPEVDTFRITVLRGDELVANILTGTKKSYHTKSVKLEQTPHYKALKGKTQEYTNYLNTFMGGPLTANYSLKKFMNLNESLMYPPPALHNSFIIVKKNAKGQYIIQDGLHRACILRHRHIKKFPVVII